MEETHSKSTSAGDKSKRSTGCYLKAFLLFVILIAHINPQGMLLQKDKPMRLLSYHLGRINPFESTKLGDTVFLD